MKPYKCVDCELYDALELYAIRRSQVKIKYRLVRTDDTPSLVEDIVFIRTLETKNKAEYLITDKGLAIRLDYIEDIAPIVGDRN